MLNSTKTWQEEFKNKFPDKIARVIDDFGDTTKSDLEQFISDLRKKDEEELIKKFGGMAYLTETIKDYYENN